MIPFSVFKEAKMHVLNFFENAHLPIHHERLWSYTVRVVSWCSVIL
jgi:hypothetical protein